MYRSIQTQNLQNYFDVNDTRIRFGSSSLEVQFLNALAAPIEESEFRVARETARSFAGAPLNIDHRGVYYKLQLPASVVLTPDANGVPQPPASIQGMVDSAWKTLQPYDDFLPVPSRVEIDPERTVVAMSEQLLFSLTGDGSTKTLTPSLPLPARLYFSIRNLVSLPAAIEILVEGETDPLTFWNGGVTRHESVLFGDGGFKATQFTWASLNSITVVGLPAGAILEAAIFQSLHDHDTDNRPFFHPLFRDQPLPRFWSACNLELEESYVLNRFEGYVPFETWSLSSVLNGLAVEPNTYGLFTASGQTLVYSDRREPMPSNLGNTGLVQEPLYGLTVRRDTQADHLRGTWFVRIDTTPYSQAANLTQYRYIVERPDGLIQVLAPEGSFATYSSYAGWRQGIPTALSMPVSMTGTYLITLEMLDQQGNLTRDIAAYANLALTPLVSLDLSSLVPQVQAIGFDSRGRFWVWTGSFLVPLRFIYDAYVFDPGSGTLYLTDSYPQVQTS